MTAIYPHLTITIKIGTITMIIRDRHRFSRLRSHSCKVIDTGVTVKVTHKGVHSRSYHWPTYHSTSHHRNSSTYHYQWDTPHRRPSSHRSFPRDCSRSMDHVHVTQTQPQKHHLKTSYRSDQTTWKNKDRNFKQVTIDYPPSKYYSSDEQSSKSNEDLN